MSRPAIWTPPTGGWCWTCCWSGTSEAGTTLVLVTHDPEVASSADRKIVLKDGLIVEDSLPFRGDADAVAEQAQNG